MQQNFALSHYLTLTPMCWMSASLERRRPAEMVCEGTNFGAEVDVIPHVGERRLGASARATSAPNELRLGCLGRCASVRMIWFPTASWLTFVVFSLLDSM